MKAFDGEETTKDDLKYQNTWEITLVPHCLFNLGDLINEQVEAALL